MNWIALLSLLLAVATPANQAPITEHLSASDASERGDLPVVPREVEAYLNDHLVIRGSLIDIVWGSKSDCVRFAPIKVQRRRNGEWLTMSRTLTSRTGDFRARMADRAGEYRAVAPHIQPSVYCATARSKVLVARSSRK